MLEERVVEVHLHLHICCCCVRWLRVLLLVRALLHMYVMLCRMCLLHLSWVLISRLALPQRLEAPAERRRQEDKAFHSLSGTMKNVEEGGGGKGNHQQQRHRHSAINFARASSKVVSLPNPRLALPLSPCQYMA